MGSKAESGEDVVRSPLEAKSWRMAIDSTHSGCDADARTATPPHRRTKKNILLRTPALQLRCAAPLRAKEILNFDVGQWCAKCVGRWAYDAHWYMGALGHVLFDHPTRCVAGFVLTCVGDSLNKRPTLRGTLNA